MNRQKSGSVWMVLPLYIFTVVFVICPLIYMVALSFATPSMQAMGLPGSSRWKITETSWNRYI